MLNFGYANERIHVGGQWIVKVIPRMRDSDELVCRVLYLPPVLLCFVCVNLAACFCLA